MLVEIDENTIFAFIRPNTCLKMSGMLEVETYRYGREIFLIHESQIRRHLSQDEIVEKFSTYLDPEDELQNKFDKMNEERPYVKI